MSLISKKMFYGSKQRSAICSSYTPHKKSVDIHVLACRSCTKLQHSTTVSYLTSIFAVTSPVAIPRLRMFPPRIPPAVCSSERSLVFAMRTADTAVCAVGTIFSTTAFPFVIKLSFCSERRFVRSEFSGIEGRAVRCTVRKSWEIF